jgi:hypothetical protein
MAFVHQGFAICRAGALQPLRDNPRLAELL